MKHDEILALCASNPEIIVSYIENLEFQIKELSEKLQALEARLNQNSRNSSKPPSTDFSLKKNLIHRVSAKKSDKKSGGQEGHLGKTLDMVSNPDQVFEHSLSCCKECGHSLENIEVEAYEKRQFFDIPPVSLIVTEYRSQIKTCPHCGRVNKAHFPESVKYPVQYDPNILASAIFFQNHHFIPYERISELFSDVMGIKICSAT